MFALAFALGPALKLALVPALALALVLASSSPLALPSPSAPVGLTALLVWTEAGAGGGFTLLSAVLGSASAALVDFEIVSASYD